MTSFFLICKHLSKRSELEMQFCQTAFFYVISLNWKIMWNVALWNPLRFLISRLFILPEVFLTIKKWRKSYLGNSLAVQWWRLRLPAQGCGFVGKQRSHMLWGQKNKTQNRSNVVTNSTKTLKMVHIKNAVLEKSYLYSLLHPG